MFAKKGLDGVNEYHLIEDSGSNENGKWVKFTDGTMICYHRKTSSSTPNGPNGSIFCTSNQTWVFPQPFKETPSISIIEGGGIGNSWATLGDSSTNLTQTSFKICRATSVTGYFPIASLYAIGRWK